MNDDWVDSERHPVRFARETELDRRISNLETSEKELADSVNRLVVQIEKLATITESMQKAIEALVEREKQIQDLQIDVSNLKASMKAIIWVSGAFVASGVALIVKFLFDSGGL